MLLTYVDESYTRDAYFIAGLGVHHEDVRSLESALHGVVANASSAFGVRVHAELHGHPLFHGEEDWDGLLPRQRIGIYGEALQAIADHDVSIFLPGVNSKRLRERYTTPHPPHDVCFQHLLERVNTYAANSGQAALIIADELHEHDRHRRNLTDFKDYGTPGYLSSKLPRIVDTIHFAPSHHSRLLQAADLVVFLHRRMKTHVESHPKAAAANEQLWARIESKVVHERIWHP